MLKENGRKKNCLVCTIALLTLLTGCAPKIWHRHDATQDDLKFIRPTYHGSIVFRIPYVAVFIFILYF